MVKADLQAVFDNAGKVEGVEVWRIEKMTLSPVDKNTYGTFYKGDAYVMLRTKKNRGKCNLRWQN